MFFEEKGNQYRRADHCKLRTGPMSSYGPYLLRQLWSLRYNIVSKRSFLLVQYQREYWAQTEK